MKKSAKKLIAILLAAVMLVSCGLVSVSAAEADYELIYGIDGYLEAAGYLIEKYKK